MFVHKNADIYKHGRRFWNNGLLSQFRVSVPTSLFDVRGLVVGTSAMILYTALSVVLASIDY